MQLSISGPPPQSIPDIDAENHFLKEVVKRAFVAFTSSKAYVVEDKGTHALYQHGDKFEGAYFLAPKAMINPNEIEYIVRYSTVKLPRQFLSTSRAIRQVLVWHSALGTGYETGLASHVFFELLGPKFGALVSDTQQTKAGVGFWRYSIKTALAANKPVWFLKDAQKIAITSDQDLVDKSKVIWGTAIDFRRVVIVIESEAQES